MVSLWRHPVLRSLLLGVLTVGGAMGLRKQSLPGAYDPAVAHLLGLPPALFRDDILTIVQLGWAWIGVSIVGSYIFHTRRLDRATAAGTSADVLMWIQYVWLLLLALLMWWGVPNPAVPGREPFFG